MEVAKCTFRSTVLLCFFFKINPPLKMPQILTYLKKVSLLIYRYLIF